MFVSQINEAAWILVFKFCSFKLFFIFIFVVLCVTGFLMMIYNDREALKTCVNFSEDCIGDTNVISTRDRYKQLLGDLKNDLCKTEAEVQSLQGQVVNLSRRRENLKNDLLTQQTDYRKMMDAFSHRAQGGETL